MRKITRVVVLKLHDTDPYSSRIRANPVISCSRHATSNKYSNIWVCSSYQNTTICKRKQREMTKWCFDSYLRSALIFFCLFSSVITVVWKPAIVMWLTRGFACDWWNLSYCGRGFHCTRCQENRFCDCSVNHPHPQRLNKQYKNSTVSRPVLNYYYYRFRVTAI